MNTKKNGYKLNTNAKIASVVSFFIFQDINTLK